MIKHFLHWFLFAFTMFAAGAPAVGGGNADTGGGAGAPGGNSGAGGAGQPADSGGASGAGAGQGTPANQGADNIRQLREAYEGIKKEFEPYQKLGLKPDQVQHYQTQYQQVHSEINTIAGQLGYSEQDVIEAIQAKGILPVLDFLRNQAWQEEQAQAGDQTVLDERALEERMNEIAERTLGPIQQRENQRMTDSANALFERTVHQLAVDLYKKEGIDVAQIPQEEIAMLMTATSEIMKYEEADIKALKFEGKTAGVQKAFQQAVAEFDKYYLARSGRDKARLQPARPGQPAQPGQKPKPSLDDIINDPSVLGAAYK